MQKAFGKLHPGLMMLIGFTMVAILGYLDYFIGDYSMLIFYAIPVALEAWFLGRLGALVIGVAAGGARFVSDCISYSDTGVRYWNSQQDMIFLLMMGLLISTIRNLLSEDQENMDR
jgi:hypothetical protein